MKRSIAPSRWKLFALDGLVILAIGIGAIIGLIVGANYGGNYAPDFQLLHYRGYEATAMVGLPLGMLIAAAIAYGIAEYFGYRGSSIFPELGFLVGIFAGGWVGEFITAAFAQLVLSAVFAFVGTMIGLRAAGLTVEQYGQHWRKR